MIQGTFRLSAIAFCATALASLIPLSPAGAAPANMRHHGAATTMRGGHAAHAMTFRGGHRFASRAHFAGRRYGYGYRRYGYHRHYRRGYGLVGGVIGGAYAYPYYTGGYYAYGYRRHHSCWWYYRYDPAATPSWCAAYSYEYPYGYDYGYAYPSYGFAFGFGERFRRHHRHFAFGDHRFGRHFAFHGATSPLEGRAASVSGGAMRHNFGAAHFGGGAHLTGGTHFMGGGAGAGAHFGGGAGAHVGGGHYIH